MMLVSKRIRWVSRSQFQTSVLSGPGSVQFQQNQERFLSNEFICFMYQEAKGLINPFARLN